MSLHSKTKRVSTLLGGSFGGKMVLLLYYFEIVSPKVLAAEDTILAVGVALTIGRGNSAHV